MSVKIKLTKNELKKQKDSLKRFQRFLPTLLLKKQQLQLEVMKIRQVIEVKVKEMEKCSSNVDEWIAVFGEDKNIKSYVQIKEILKELGNIAGVDIPIFQELVFEDKKIDLYETPIWFDEGIAILKKMISFKCEIDILNKQIELLQEELRVTTQRVNLFEKVKIPESKENIRIIEIYLGDQQTAAVVRGKISKNKILQLEELKKNKSKNNF